jgi:hypothetical protein
MTAQSFYISRKVMLHGCSCAALEISRQEKEKAFQSRLGNLKPFAVPQMPRPGHQKRHGAEEQSLFACDMLVIGDKGRSQMKRADAGSIKRSATDIVAPGTFALASGLASELMSAGAAQEYDAVVMVYNEFVNAATYKQMYKIIKPFKTETEDGQDILATYEFEPDEKSAALVDMEKLKKQRRDKGLSKKRG